MTLNDLETAAFWDQSVCLDCEAVFEFPTDDGLCPECGSDTIHTARFILRCRDLIAPDSEDAL